MRYMKGATITVTLGCLMDHNWDLACEIKGLNPWCINEGRANQDDTIDLTADEAVKIGIMDPPRSNDG